MKLFYFIILLSTIFCFHEDLMNLEEVQNKKLAIINYLKSSLTQSSKEYLKFAHNFRFNGDIIIDAIPYEKLAEEAENYGVPDEYEYKQGIEEMEFMDAFTYDPINYHYNYSNSSAEIMYQDVCSLELSKIETSTGYVILFIYIKGEATILKQTCETGSGNVKSCYKIENVTDDIIDYLQHYISLQILPALLGY